MARYSADPDRETAMLIARDAWLEKRFGEARRVLAEIGVGDAQWRALKATWGQELRRGDV